MKLLRYRWSWDLRTWMLVPDQKLPEGVSAIPWLDPPGYPYVDYYGVPLLPTWPPAEWQH